MSTLDATCVNAVARRLGYQPRDYSEGVTLFVSDAVDGVESDFFVVNCETTNVSAEVEQADFERILEDSGNPRAAIHEAITQVLGGRS